jgi:phage repressor protein C with HTH and peptisase S24 domain
MTKIERLRKLCKWLIYIGYADNDAELASKLGYTKSSFSQIINEKVPLSDKFIDKICAVDQNINKVWINTGKSVMLHSEIQNPITNHLQVNEPAAVFNQKTISLVDNQKIPLYNIEATAGIVTLFNDTSEIKPIDYIQIPNLPKCDGAVYVSGDSMYPLLKSGDIIMYKQIHNIKDGIFWGEMYMISIDQDGDEMVTVKYIQKSDKGEKWIKLVSQNKHHGDRDVSLNKVKALALIKASIRINSMS